MLTFANAGFFSGVFAFAEADFFFEVSAFATVGFFFDSASFGDLVDLGSMSVTNNSVNGSATFNSVALDTFLNNDGNNIATFLVYHTNGTGNVGGFKSKETGTNTGATLTLVPVPEPSSFALMFGGLALCIAANRRKR